MCTFDKLWRGGWPDLSIGILFTIQVGLMASLVMGGTKLSTTHATAIRPAAAATTMKVRTRPIYFYAIGPAKVVTQ